LTDNQLGYWNRVRKKGWVPRLRAAAVRILGPLDTAVLNDSIDAVVRRHESLRTRIVGDGDDGPFRQEVAEGCEYRSDFVDLSSGDSADSARQANLLAAEFFRKRTDLYVEPVLAALLLRISASEHVFLLGLDHIVGDGASCGILSREVWAAYHQLSQGLPVALPAMAVQFPDYAVWRQNASHGQRAVDEAYWATRMSGMVDVQVPLDRQPQEVAQAGAMLSMPFGKSVSDGLRGVAIREHTLLPIVVLTVHVVVMSHWCRCTDFPVLFASHGRYGRAELQNMIGFLSRVLPLRIGAAEHETLRTVLKRAHAEFTSAIEHQEFVPAHGQINLAQAFNWGGLVTYSARWSVDQQRKAVHGLRIQPFPVDHRDDCTFYPTFSDTPSGIVVNVNYRPDLLSAATIERLGQRMRRVADALARSPDTTIGALALDQ